MVQVLADTSAEQEKQHGQYQGMQQQGDPEAGVQVAYTVAVPVDVDVMQEAKPAYYQQVVGGNVMIVDQPAYPGGYPSPRNIIVLSGPPPGHVHPPDYCLLAWLSAILCCWPVGICAVICSCSVGSHWNKGDVDGARRASRWTRNLSLVSIAFGSAIIIGIVVMEGQ